MSANRKPVPRVRWVLAIAITVVVNILLFATRSGRCVDYVYASIADSCTTEPIPGAAGTWRGLLVDFESRAAADGWRYFRATTRGDLDRSLTASTEPTLIDVPLAR